MAKRINKNMVAGLAFVGFGIMTAAGVLMIFALRNTDPQRFVEIAAEHIESSDWQAAGLYYRRAYDVSKDEKYLVEMGQMVYNSGNEAKAQQIWQSALTQNPQLVPALVKLLDYAVEVAERFPSGRSWRKVRECAGNLLEQRPEDLQALYNRGRSLLALQSRSPENLELGIKDLRRAVELAPENVDYSLALAMIEAQEGGSSDAEAFFQRLLEANTDPGADALKVRALYGRLLASRSVSARARNEEEKAADLGKQALTMFEDGVKLAGEDKQDQIDARVQLGRYLLATELAELVRNDAPQDQIDAAVDHIKTLFAAAIDIDPSEFEAYLALGDLHGFLKEYTQAIEVYERRLGEDIDRKGLRGSERKRNLYRILIRAADTCVSAVSDMTYTSPERSALLDKGDRFIRDAKAEMPTSPQGYHYEGKLLLTRGKDLEALAAFEEADKRYSRPNAEIRIYLASIYLIHKQLGAAEEALAEVIKNPRASSRAWLTYARVLLEAKEPERATQAAQQALIKSPNSREILLVLSEGFRQMGRPDLVDEVMRQLGDDPSNAFIRVRALVGQERFEEALVGAKKILETDPGNTTMAVLAVQLHRKLEQHEEALGVIGAALLANPKDLKLQKFALALEPDLSKEERKSRYLAIIEAVEDQYVRVMELAKFYQSQEQWDDAEKYLAQAEQLLADRATPAAVQRTRAKGESALRETSDRRFAIICSRQDWEAAERLARDAASRNVDGVDGLTYFGRIQLFRDEPELAADTFRQALDRQPNNSQTLTYLGQAYLDLKRLDQAQTTFERAIKLNPGNGLAHKGLAMLAKYNQNASAYTDHLSECLRLMPSDKWVDKEVALLRKLTNPEEALAEYEQKWKDNPEDIEAVMNLADLYARAGHVEDASARFDDARKLAPESLLVAHTASELERRFGSKSKAEEILIEHRDFQTEPRLKAAAYLLLAQLYVNENQFEKADAAYLSAGDLHQGITILFAIGRHFFTTDRPEMAIDWLEKASRQAQKEGDESQTQQINKMCAEAHLNAGKLDKAKTLVEELLARDTMPGNIALLFKAEIEARLGQFGKAVESLSEFLEARPDHALALFRRARYRGVQGKWSLAIDDLELLRARDPNALELAPRKRLAVAYGRVGRTDSAIGELEALLNEHPDKSDVALMLVEMLLKHERFNHAKRICRTMMNRQPENPIWVYQQARVPLRRAETIDDEQAKKNLVQQAMQAMRRACVMADFAPALVVHYLNACQKHQSYSEGIDLYEKSLEMSDRVPPVSKAYAGLLARTGAIEQAISAYRRAAHVGRKQSGAMIVQAIAGEATEILGLEQFIALLREPPKDERLLQTNQMLLAAALTVDKQFSEASTLLSQTLEQSTEDVDRAVVLLLLATTADQAGESERARKAYEEVIALEPLNWVAHNNLAYLLCERLGRCEEALPYAQRAKSVTARPAVADTLATVYLGLNREREAVSVLGRALNDDPRFVPGYLRLGEAYRRLGEFAEAEEVLNQATRMPETESSGLMQELNELLDKVRKRDSSH